MFIAAEAAWEPSAALMVAIMEPNRDRSKRSRPFEAKEFNPFARARGTSPRRGIPVTRENIGVLKAAFIKDKLAGK